MSKADGTTFTHGHSGYSNHGCRCDECREGMRAYSRRYYERNADKVKAKVRAWEIENRDRVNARARAASAKPENKAKRQAYYQANREAFLAKSKLAAQANPERARRIKAAYKKRYPDKDRAHVEIRRARKASADTRLISERDWQRLCARHDNRCAYCGAVGKLSQDHIIPIARGGRHAIGNLVPACITCNSSKGTKLLVEWRRARN